MKELQTVESCVEVVTAEMAALCHALQQHKKNVSISHGHRSCSVCTVFTSYLPVETDYHESIKLPDLNIIVCLSNMQNFCSTASVIVILVQ